MFDQVVITLQRAKDNYAASLRSIDSELRKIVSQDPSTLAGARAIQASYGEGFEGADLAAAEQPFAGPFETATSTRRSGRARKTPLVNPDDVKNATITKKKSKGKNAK